MEEVYENNWEKCDYCEVYYYESDTGYKEYKCELVDGECCGGDIEYGCPLSFKYHISK